MRIEIIPGQRYLDITVQMEAQEAACYVEQLEQLGGGHFKTWNQYLAERLREALLPRTEGGATELSNRGYCDARMGRFMPPRAPVAAELYRAGYREGHAAGILP